MSDDLGLRAHEAAEKHLNACFEALYAEDDERFDVEWPAILQAPFCGCETCVVREVLNAAWTYLIEMASEQ